MAFNGYVQVPPDSTGKKIGHTVTIEVGYDTGTIPFEIGDIVTGASSGVYGYIVKIDGTTSSGTITITLLTDSLTTFILAENLQVLSVTYAKTTTTGAPLYTPTVSVVDHRNPFVGQRINTRGAALTAFVEGEPSLDAFNNLRVSSGEMIAEYEHTQRDYGDLFSMESGSGATATHQQATATFLLSCNSTATAYIKRTTNRYHYYMPGTGTTTILTLGLSDTGRANNIRRWGYYDDDNGLFFELSGSTFRTVVRKGGVDIATNSNNFNNDKLDGTGISEFHLDVSKENFYWIDMAWLGVGAVRYGIVDSYGERVICHTNRYSNTSIGPYMNTPHLPIRWENTNYGVTSGTSDIRVVCAAVYSDAHVLEGYTTWRNCDVESSASVGITTQTPLFSVRNSQANLLGSGINRVSIYPETLALFVNNGYVKMDLIVDAGITGSNWTSSSLSTIAYDSAGTSTNITPDSFKFISYNFGPGCHNFDLKPYFEFNDEALVLRADGRYRTYSFCLTNLSGSQVSASATLNYRELS